MIKPKQLKLVPYNIQNKIMGHRGLDRETTVRTADDGQRTK